MWECRHCGEYIRRSRDRMPSRCPRCREPMFERAGGPDLVDERYPDKGVCAMHESNAAIGACKRCGNFFCPVCRTRWQERVLCLPCVERYMSGEEKNPEERRGHGRQAILACIFGVAAWVLLILTFVTALPATQMANGEGLLVLAFLLLISSFIAAVAGLGQAIPAIFVRGQRLIAATSGLVLSGTYLGVFLGLLIFQIGR